MRRFLVLVMAMGLFLGGCGQQPDVSSDGERADAPINIVGAGASFPYPLYARWNAEYDKLANVRLNYNSIGSGGGVKQIKAKTVDYGASDKPLSGEELDEAGLLQFPMIMGSIVMPVNLEGIEPGQLRLSSDAIAGIFLGEIKKWNEPRIAETNPDLELPDLEITVVHRTDSSGTTYIFTNYLAGISEKWKEEIGVAKTVPWPVGLGGKGNEGVTSYVQRLKGSIGYVEYAYALENNLSYSTIQNAAGNYVTPGMEAFQAAASQADWDNTPGYAVDLTNQAGENAWPIVGASFILMHKNQPDAKKAEALLRYFDWCYTSGADMAQDLHYVPIPESVATKVRGLWATEMQSNSKPVWGAAVN